MNPPRPVNAVAPVGRRRLPLPRPVAGQASVLTFRFDALWRFFVAQDLAFWAMCFYLIVEYVRPQQSIQAIYGMPLGQIGLGAALIGYVLSARGFVFGGLGSVFMLLFTGVIIASSFTAYNPDYSFLKFMDVWFTWVIIYFLIINVVVTRERFVFYIIMWMMCHYYMSQGGFRQFAMRGFRFATWGITGAPGWFANSGEFAIAMCMFLAISAHFYAAARPYLKEWWRKAFVLGMPLTAAFGVIGSSSRGAVVGMAAIGAYTLTRTKINVRTVIGLAVFAASAWLVLPAEQKARFSSAGEDKTSVMRKVYWLNGLEMAKEHPVLGIGYENWMQYYYLFYRDSPISDAYDVHTVQVPHNIFIQCMAELGYVGLAVFLCTIAANLFVNYQTRKIVRTGLAPPDTFITHMAYAMDGAMLSYLVAGFFVTVLYYPFFWVNLALTVALNHIAKRNAAEATIAARRVQRPPVVRGVPSMVQPR